MTHQRRVRRGRHPLVAVVAAIGVLVLVGTSVAAAAPTPTPAPRGNRVTPEVADEVAQNGTAQVVVHLDGGEALSKVTPLTQGPARAEARRRAENAIGDLPPGSYEGAIDAPGGIVPLTVNQEALDHLADAPGVASVTINHRNTVDLTRSAPAVGAPIAWAGGYTGAGQTVAIVDTGVDASHPFLGGRVVAEGCFSAVGIPGSVASSNCPGGSHQVTGGGAAAPCSGADGCGHGTHVAGIAAGSNGPSTAKSGIAPAANIIAVDVFSSDYNTSHCGGAAFTPCIGAYDTDIYYGLQYVVSLEGSYSIAAVNMSLGGGIYTGACDSTDPATTAAIGQLRAAGTATVVASGNDGSTTRISHPGCIAAAVTVGSIDVKTTTVSSFSNSGSMLDLLAPGAYDPSTGIRSSVPGAAYANISGTSMATPHVTAAFAIVKEAYPGISVDLAEYLLKASGRPITDARNGRVTPMIALDEAIPKTPGTYHPVAPARLLDTRDGTGAPHARLAANASIDLQVGGQGGVPSSGVGAVVLNVTAVAPSSVGYVTVWPTGSLLPDSSNLNLVPGDVRPNLVTVRMGAGGKVSLYNKAGSVDLVADVAGWYDDGADTGSMYHAVSPVRILDTRNGTGGFPVARLGPASTIDLPVAGAAGSPVPSGATAVVVNITGTDSTAGGFVTAWPADVATPPNASTLNLSASETRPNLAIVRLSPDGHLKLYNDSGQTNLVVDVQGWFDGTSGGKFVPRSPRRVLDTRSGIGSFGALGAHGSIDLAVAGQVGIPSSGVVAVVLNTTAVDPSSAGFVTAYPAGSSRPNASNLNLEPGSDTPNLVMAQLGSGGKLRLYNDAGSVNLVADVAGWFQ